MAWRLARSLETLRAEVNRFAPNRSKISDGTLGDPAHAGRASRHNPNRYGVVTALDLTDDPAGGFDVHAFARRHVRDPHPELAYIISNGQVAKRATGFRWETYTGANAHRLHGHFGVGVGPDSDPLPPYDSTDPWGVAPPAPTLLALGGDPMVIRRKENPKQSVLIVVDTTSKIGVRGFFSSDSGIASGDEVSLDPSAWRAVVDNWLQKNNVLTTA